MKKLMLINGSSSSPVTKEVTDGYTVLYVHENGTITANYSSIYAASFAKLATQIKDDDTDININQYTFKMTYKGYYMGNDDDWMFNVGWSHAHPDDLAKASRDLSLYRKNLISFDKLRKYNVIHITNLYSQFDINRLIKFVIIPMAKEFSDLVELEDSLPYEDPISYWDVSPVVVHISKYQFRLVNNYYRTIKFIEWVITDDVPKAVCNYSGIVTGIFNGKRTYQYDRKLTNVSIDDTDNLTVNGWVIKADNKYASNSITKVNYQKEVIMPKSLDESLYDGKKWLASFCLPNHCDYTNKQLLEIYKYSVSTEDTVLEGCYDMTYRIIGAIRYLRDLGYEGYMFVNIQPKNTELPDIIDPIAKQEVFDTRDTVLVDLVQLGVETKIIDNDYYVNGIGEIRWMKETTDYTVGMDEDGFLTYTSHTELEFTEGDFNEYGLLAVKVK